MSNECEKWDSILKNLERLEGVNSGLFGLSIKVGALQDALTNIEGIVGDLNELKGATIVGTLNMLVAMIESIQRTIQAKVE